MTGYAHILRSPWQKRHNQHSRWVAWLIASVWLLAALTVAWLAGTQAAEKVARFGAALVVTVLWGEQFSSLMAQNTPVAARLVPGQLRALRTTAVVVWLCATAMLVLVLPKGMGWIWGSGLALLLIAFIFRWPLALTGLLVATTFAWDWASHSLWWWQLTLPMSAQITCVVVGGVLAAGLLCSLFQSGGNRHVQHHSQRARWREAWRFGNPGTAAPSQSRWVQWSSRWLDAPFHAWLRHLTATATPTERSVMARIEMAIAPGSHWTAMLKNFGISLSAFTALYLATHYIFGLDIQTIRTRYGTPLSIGILGTIITAITMVPSHYYRSRREQALLALLPGIPSGTRFNHALARRKLLHFAVLWLLLNGLTWMLLTGGDTDSSLYPPLFGFGIGCLPVGLLVLRDWSRLSQPGALTHVFPPMMILLGFAMFGVMDRLHWLSWLGLVAMLGLCVTIVAWRWRRLGLYPHALPVGRMSHNAQ